MRVCVCVCVSLYSISLRESVAGFYELSDSRRPWNSWEWLGYSKPVNHQMGKQRPRCYGDTPLGTQAARWVSWSPAFSATPVCTYEGALVNPHGRSACITWNECGFWRQGLKLRFGCGLTSCVTQGKVFTLASVSSSMNWAAEIRLISQCLKEVIMRWCVYVHTVVPSYPRGMYPKIPSGCLKPRIIPNPIYTMFFLYWIPMIKFNL